MLSHSVKRLAVVIPAKAGIQKWWAKSITVIQPSLLVLDTL